MPPTIQNSPSRNSVAPRVAPRRESPLTMDAEEFRRVGTSLVDSIARYLEGIPEGPVTPVESPGAVRALLGAERGLPETGQDAQEIARSTTDLLFQHSLFNGHPRFFGYITSSPAPIGMLGDLLAAAVNANVGAWQLAPMASEIEAQAVRWIAELIGYPEDTGGLFVSGGNMANMVGFLAARAAAAGAGVREKGMASGAERPLRVYVSAETHTWIEKATDLAGLGTDAIRWIPTDSDLRMDTAALRKAIRRDRAAGDQPMMVVATAGSVSTGAVDPIFEIADICREAGVWLHVDGAYGALAAAAPGTPHDLKGLRHADSVAVDPHKWLYSPLEAGCLLVRDNALLRDAFSYHPPYFHFGEEATNYLDLGPQNSRGFRALKVWLALRHAGREGYARMIGEDIALSERLHRRVMEEPELEAATQGLSITTFRYVPEDMRPDPRTGKAAAEAEADYLNRLNEALLERIQASGEAFVSNGVIRGRYLLRACIVNFNTGPEDVDALPEIVVRLGREVDAEMRSPLSTGSRWRPNRARTGAW